jgi:hypothetical protein
MTNTPRADANKRAKREMHKAVDKVIDEKKEEEIGTKEAEAGVAADLHAAAQEGTRTRGRQQREKGGTGAGSHKLHESSVPRIRSGTQCVTQITVVETDPGKQSEAVGVMTERARFMARQPGFISITAVSMAGASSTTSSGRAGSSCSRLISHRSSGRNGGISMT